MFTSKIFFAVLILFFFSHQIFAQAQSILKLTDIPFEFNKISDIRNGYTLQSNSSPQQLWIDPQNPEYLHAVFMNSQFKTDWPDRTCLYFGSDDFGQSWFELGSVPDTSRSGFPAIYGNTGGAAIIVNHSNYFGSPTRTGLFIDNGPFENNFAAYDPGFQPVTIWPKCIMVPDGDIWIASLSQMSDSLTLNSFDPDSSTFSGWNVGETSKPNAYTFSVSNNGKIGFAFIGGEGLNEGDVFYLETTNGGITWSIPIKIFDCPAEQGIAVGALRGISLNFSSEEPCVVFETCQQDFSQWGGRYFPRLPNQILFWSPNINSGDAKVIANNSNVPFAPSLNPSDFFPPLCRPVIGRVQDYDNVLVVAFSASTENIYFNIDSVTYFAGYLMYTTNGGETWDEPQKFTPDEPLLDWKYISTVAVYPVFGIIPYQSTILHFVLQADSLEGNSNPLSLNAQYYHASIETLIPDIWDAVEDESQFSDFKLEQNYPNPFNPSTKIKYQIPVGGFVTLKVYDVLGNEVVTLVNEEKPAGSYDLEFNAVGLPSGIYFYTLRATNYIQTRKMILLK
jgi:hypothetical protein